MKNILIVYYSRMGHTARMVRTIADELEALGNTVTVMPVSEALREGVDWSKHDFVLCGFPVVYGTYHPNVYEFVRNNCTELDRKPNAMFNVTVVARTPFKATVEGNRYMQKFLERSPWRPRDLKCFAGKIDYPHLNLFDKKCIQLIMKITSPNLPTKLNLRLILNVFISRNPLKLAGYAFFRTETNDRYSRISMDQALP